MAWKLAEQLVNEVAAYLTANDAAKIAVLNTEYADTLLEEPSSWATSEKVLGAVQSWPVGIVLVESTPSYHWRGPKITAEHSLLVGMLVKDQDLDNLRKKMYRNARMIVELLAEAGDLTSGYNLGVGSSEVNFSPLFEAAGSEFSADLHVRMTVVLEESKT